ncbi:MAG: hypothetical protein MZU97_25045 [Bacillus subtilis]|nr:hypothetical protein [Bacillus subtilis]
MIRPKQCDELRNRIPSDLNHPDDTSAFKSADMLIEFVSHSWIRKVDAVKATRGTFGNQTKKT